jgi:hypothetical protein
MQRLAREKICLQERLASLKGELSRLNIEVDSVDVELESCSSDIQNCLLVLPVAVDVELESCSSGSFFQCSKSTSMLRRDNSPFREANLSCRQIFSRANRCISSSYKTLILHPQLQVRPTNNSVYLRNKTNSTSTATGKTNKQFCISEEQD